MNLDELLKLTENERIEFKLCKNELPKSFFETYSSFANTCGGDIYLGVEEQKGHIINVPGVDNIEKIKREIFDNLNNPLKVSSNLIRNEDIEIIENKVIKVHVPELDRGSKPLYLNNNILFSYKRNFEGDYKISQSELISFLNDKIDSSNDSEINNKGLNFDDINIETLQAFRNIFNANNPNNIFSQFDNEEFCKKVGILKKDQNNRYLLTNAGVLFFTNNLSITSVFPNYFVDYQENFTETTRWDYRLVSIDLNWSGNLFDFFINVFNRLKIGVPNKFSNTGVVDTSAKPFEDAIKEALVNAISNIDFFMTNCLIVKKGNNRIEIKNSGKSLIGYEAMISGGNTNPRNKEIMRYFRLLMFSQRSGYGIPNIINICKENNFPLPIITESNIPESILIQLFTNGTDLININSLNAKDVLAVISASNGISLSSLAEKFECDNKTMREVIIYLISKSLIKDNGNKTKGKLYFSN